jgi:hypothetical protein
MLHELLSLEWLAGKVGKHVDGTILDFQISLIDAVLYEIIPDVDLTCPFA